MRDRLLVVVAIRGIRVQKRALESHAPWDSNQRARGFNPRSPIFSAVYRIWATLAIW